MSVYELLYQFLFLKQVALVLSVFCLHLCSHLLKERGQLLGLFRRPDALLRPVLVEVDLPPVLLVRGNVLMSISVCWRISAQ